MSGIFFNRSSQAIRTQVGLHSQQSLQPVHTLQNNASNLRSLTSDATTCTPILRRKELSRLALERHFSKFSIPAPTSMKIDSPNANTTSKAEIKSNAAKLETVDTVPANTSEITHANSLRKQPNMAIIESKASSEIIQLCGLSNANFADSYSSEVKGKDISATDAAHAIFSSPPRFAVALMSVRNRIVSLFGIKTPDAISDGQNSAQRIGIFPVISRQDDSIILGLDDKHLDFRICVTSRPSETTLDSSHISLSTVVKTKNTFGKLYLSAVMPFHRLLSQQMFAIGLKRLSQRTVPPQK